MAFITKKTSLRRILRDPDKHSPILEDAIIRTNQIVYHGYNLLNLFYRHSRESGPSPLPDKKFIFMVFRVVSTTSIKRKDTKHPYFDAMCQFFAANYAPTMAAGLSSRDHLTQILDYEADTAEIMIKNNIQAQFVRRLYEYINNSLNVKELLRVSSSGPEKTAVFALVRAVKTDVLTGSMTAPVEYRSFVEGVRQMVIPTLIKSVHYDLVADPFKFFPGFIRLHWLLNGKFVLIPSRSSNIPAYITLDTQCLRALFGITSGRNITPKDIIWRDVFYIQKRDFRSGSKPFHWLLKTDGIGVSLCFEDGNIMKPKRKQNSPDNHSDYITSMTLERRGNRQIVAIDPNKEDIIYCVGHSIDITDEPTSSNDKLQVFRHTKARRNIETKMREYRRRRLKLARKTHVIARDQTDAIFNPSIEELNTHLSQYTARTANFADFLTYLRHKIPIAEITREHYASPIYRWMRWRSYINTQRSEAQMVNRFAATYGLPHEVIICFGDYSQSHLRGTEPVKGKSIHRLFCRRGYEVKLVDEFRTSKCCCKCDSVLEQKFHPQICKRPGKYFGKQIKCHGLTRCTTCLNGVRLWNRDLNAALNIYRVAEQILSGLPRPPGLCRANKQIGIR